MKDFDVRDFLRRALTEDIGDGDHTTLATIPAHAEGKAKLLVKDKGVLAGAEIARMVFELIDPDLIFESVIEDGQKINQGDIAFFLSGSSRSITTGERLALNIMQRMSGIASRTRHLKELLTGTKAKLLDTRKTTPGFRYFEKLAVTIGGGENHRFGLFDMILVKDNHVDYAGGIKPALEKISAYLAESGKNLRVEVEARNLEEVRQILEEKIAFRILLDNFNIPDLHKAVEFIGGRVQTEASGGISEHNIREYALTGVDYISMGALTHSVRSLDLSLKALNQTVS